MLAGCNRVPSYVIQPEEMAELMADVRTADAVISVRSQEYVNDASRLALKQAVFERHDVTPEQFDTSMMWYGHNIGRYQQVTERSIEILEERLKVASALAAGQAAMSVSGDSVDVWQQPQMFAFHRNSPSRFITFALYPDQNWQPGDIYTLRAHVVTPPAEARWNITAAYDDGTFETVNSTLITSEANRQGIALYTDSTRRTIRISGFIDVAPDGIRPAILDSIGLTRRRKDPAGGYRRSSQRLIRPAADHVSTDTTARL